MTHYEDGLAVAFLLLTHFIGGGSLPIDPPQLVTAMVGDDVVLPCLLDPPPDAVSMTMEWGRADMKPRFVLVWHDGKELLTGQNEAFKGRTSLSISGLKRGDVSLKLSSVKVSDSGTYRCYLQKPNQEHLVQLLVGAASSPAISLAGLHLASSAVLLHCESRGWYPEPELLWLDAEGKLLSAGLPETLRGPDDLYSVSSSVTVEKRHRNSFTCRVQQRNINQTRETLITVPEDFFVAPAVCTPCVAFSVVFAFLFVIIVVVLLVWRRRHKITDTKTQQSLMEEERRREDLKKKEEEQKDLIQIIDLLTEQNNELIEQRDKVGEQMKKLQKQEEENEEKVDLVEKDEREKEGENKGHGLLKMRRIITENNWKLQERKEELQLLSVNLDKISQKCMNDLKRLTEKKKNLDIDVEKIKKQLEEIQGAQ
uniref:butyrophilin subfamily 3 member A2-like n=1 Tax=Gasterosteus aculeatus aculeatus TaxID=481459 RepID=UPI001A97F53B|nr:butyrophilin subfamily 3 member A2-like [Gasterosteus aculeatus aculeatus]